MTEVTYVPFLSVGASKSETFWKMQQSYHCVVGSRPTLLTGEVGPWLLLQGYVLTRWSWWMVLPSFLYKSWKYDWKSYHRNLYFSVFWNIFMLYNYDKLLIWWVSVLDVLKSIYESLIIPWVTLWRSGWGTALRTRRSRVRFPMVSLDFFHWHNPSVRTMAMGLTQPPTEMNARNISWG
jgi:hypothetical protein